MATYKVKAYGKEYTVEVLDRASGARIIVEGYSFEVDAAAPGSVPGHGPAAGGPPPTPTTASPAPAARPAPKRAAKTAPAKAASKSAPAASSASGAGAVVAPIPGVITKVCVAEGDEVQAGHTVVKLEAMKMENDITALTSGTVREVGVEEGNEVAEGQLLVLIE